LAKAKGWGERKMVNAKQKKEEENQRKGTGGVKKKRKHELGKHLLSIAIRQERKH